MNATIMEMGLAAQGDVCAPTGRKPARFRYFKRVSDLVERIILVFVILATLLGNYMIHGYLMREMLIS